MLTSIHESFHTEEENVSFGVYDVRRLTDSQGLNWDEESEHQSVETKAHEY